MVSNRSLTLHLLIAVTVPIVENYGLDMILQPLIRDLRTLATDSITVVVNGVQRKHFKVLCYCVLVIT